MPHNTLIMPHKQSHNALSQPLRLRDPHDAAEVAHRAGQGPERGEEEAERRERAGQPGGDRAGDLQRERVL